MIDTWADVLDVCFIQLLWKVYVDIDFFSIGKRKERQDLLDAVRKEARRTMVRDLVGTNQETRIFQLEEMPDEEFDNFPVERLDWNRISRYYASIEIEHRQNCYFCWHISLHLSRSNHGHLTNAWSSGHSRNIQVSTRSHGQRKNPRC